MIRVVTGEYGREEKIFLVPDGVDIKIAPQAPTGGRQEILWITNEDGDTVAAFASWRAAVYVEESDSEEIGYHRMQAARAAGIDLPED